MIINQDTGLLSPSATGSAFATNQWSDPTNAYSSNNSYTLGQVAYPAIKEQDYYNFGFVVPDGAVILGIEVRVEYYNLFAPTQRIYIKSTSGAGYVYKAIGYDSVEAVKTYGEAADVWGTTWVPSDFSNANFFSKLYVSSPVSGTKYLYVDHLQVKVYYKIFVPNVVLL